jgi:hypothetical protein
MGVFKYFDFSLKGAIIYKALDDWSGYQLLPLTEDQKWLSLK